jgi:hypothetical protein
MARGSIFIQRHEDAVRHVALLAKGLKKVAMVGAVGGLGCTALAMFLTHVLIPPNAHGNAIPGAHEMSGITFVTWFMALALLFFSSLYYVAGWGLANQKGWGRYVGAAAFLLKAMLCIWLGRSSVQTMVVFLFVATWDFYGLWVLLSKETAHLFTSPEVRTATVKPADLSV